MEEEKKDLITIEELSKASGQKLKILSSYVRKGFLFYDYQGSDGIRYYNKNKALKNLNEIKKLEKEGYTAKEIKERFVREHLFDSLSKIAKQKSRKIN